MFKSLRNRIILAFSLIIISAVVMSTLVALWSANYQLEEFVTDISLNQVVGLAGIVEVEYNLRSNLDSVNSTFRKLGRKQSQNSPLTAKKSNPQWQSIINQHGHRAAVCISRIMRLETQNYEITEDLAEVIDIWYRAYATVHNSSTPKDLRLVDPLSFEPGIDFTIQYSKRRTIKRERHPEYGEGVGEHSAGSNEHVETYEEQEYRSKEHQVSVPFYNWVTQDVAGYVITDRHKEYRSESNEFNRGTITNNLYGGLLSAILALGIAIWLAQKISTPIKSLIQAANHLATDGETEHIEVNSADELGQLGLAFNSMAESIKAQREVRRQMIADISHELNTPLSIMKLEAKGMLDGMQNAEGAANNILGEIGVLKGLIADLELIAEADQKVIQLEIVPISLSEFLGGVVDRWRVKADSKSVTLEIEDQAKSLAIPIDPDRIRQVLDNLLKNSLQHTDSEGIISIGVTQNNDELIISVGDDGHGIPSEHLPKLFDRFYSVDSIEKQQPSSRGLGLAIVKQLVELHGGNVWVESELGVGSTFSFSIPIV